ncbi:uncharacterized protein FOMMEDRAFT_162657 [Fomitiporia mediterranea MF3/22]|uniref:Uncharacterized protein n=1 Tax=Fomitiporia mediterranea (strain MF3/22) TaxID=694068 RepID=R7SJ40_FOMME|nr:uncharacterized protein FOMMEDRAFT_162657 [Fomitiporia mediterranea MF3/22]EJC97634.1 hypothetical protein FOMMEDRAFT_162657 [Fomitiporia mediterranea MF3/22]
MHHSHSLHAATARTPREYTPRSTVQFTAPPIAKRSQSMQCARTDAAQISSFNAPDLNPSAPLTLATRHPVHPSPQSSYPLTLTMLTPTLLANQSHKLSHP